MAFETIIKDPRTLKVTPNLVDYEAARAPGFWEQARAELDGLPGGEGLNIAHEAVDRHAVGARAEHLALDAQRRRGAHGSTTPATRTGVYGGPSRRRSSSRSAMSGGATITEPSDVGSARSSSTENQAWSVR